METGFIGVGEFAAALRTASLDLARAKRDAGITFLNKHRPGWQARVNTSTLRLTSGCHCVAGQVFTQEAAACPKRPTCPCEECLVHSGYMHLLHCIPGAPDPEDLGFDGSTGVSYDALQVVWLEYLEQWHRDQDALVAAMVDEALQGPSALVPA